MEPLLLFYNKVEIFISRENMYLTKKNQRRFLFMIDFFCKGKGEKYVVY